MKPNEENNLVLKLCEYGISKDEFILSRFFKEYKLNQGEQNYVNSILCHQSGEPNPNQIVTVSGDYFQHILDSDLEFFSKGDFRNRSARLLPTAIFNFTDHLEIVEARKAAKEAKRLATWSLWISSVLAFISIIVGILQLSIK